MINVPKRTVPNGTKRGQFVDVGIAEENGISVDKISKVIEEYKV